MKNIMIFGHKNPDTDSVASAIALSHLRNQREMHSTPYILGNLSKESKFVLDYFNVKEPKLLKDVKIQIKDLDYDKIIPLKLDVSILHAYNHMNKNRIRTLPIVSDDNKLIGIITMKDIAMSMIKHDNKKIVSTFDNILQDLKGTSIVKSSSSINGEVTVAAFHSSTIKQRNILTDSSILIVGDRLEVLRYAITKKVQLIIVTGGRKIPDEYIKEAKECDVNIMTTPHETYETTRLISLTSFVGTLIKRNGIITFKDNEYLENCKDIIQTSKHSKFPVIDKDRYYKGIISRRHILNPGKKTVILVDHNEFSQSAEGIQEANIIEVVDHHKIGEITTTLPIAFRNLPVGSTNTIIYFLYQEENVKIPQSIAGLMLSGIISDTLLLKSPTTTYYDKMACESLTKMLEINLEEYAMKMFEAGTSLKGKSVDEVFHSDFKEFVIEGCKVGISQVFTLDVSQISKDRENYLAYINQLSMQKDHYATLMVITDIVKEGSYLYYSDNSEEVVRIAINQTPKQGMYIQDIVSRKKQIIPRLSEAINIIKK